jgi:hypothetical protein
MSTMLVTMPWFVIALMMAFPNKDAFVAERQPNGKHKPKPCGKHPAHVVGRDEHLQYYRHDRARNDRWWADDWYFPERQPGQRRRAKEFANLVVEEQVIYPVLDDQYELEQEIAKAKALAAPYVEARKTLLGTLDVTMFPYDEIATLPKSLQKEIQTLWKEGQKAVVIASHYR